MVAVNRTWVRLETGNDWGSIYYAPVGQALSAGGTASAKRGVRLTPGHKYHFRLKDGSEVERRLCCQPRRSTVSDQGRDCSVTENWLFAEMQMNGHNVLVPLVEVEILLTDEELNLEGRPEYALLRPDTVAMVRASDDCPGVAVVVCLDGNVEALTKLGRAIAREGLRLELMKRDEIEDTARHMTTECVE